MPPPDAGCPAWQSAPLRSTDSSSTRDDEQNKANDENLAPTPTPAPPPLPSPPSTPITTFSRSWQGKLAYAALILLGVGLVVAAFVPVSAAAAAAIPPTNQNRGPQAHVSPTLHTSTRRDCATPPHLRHSSNQSSRTGSWTTKPLAMAGSLIQVHPLPQRQQLQVSFPRRRLPRPPRPPQPARPPLRPR